MSAAGHLNPAVPKPAHIPDELVYDYDAYRDPELLADPSKRIARMGDHESAQRPKARGQIPGWHRTRVIPPCMLVGHTQPGVKLRGYRIELRLVGRRRRLPLQESVVFAVPPTLSADADRTVASARSPLRAVDLRERETIYRCGFSNGVLSQGSTQLQEVRALCALLGLSYFGRLPML
jgi:hypothetical protein